MEQERYWRLPDSGRIYRALPETQIAGQPLPTTWAGVGPARAMELGAVEVVRDRLPPFHSIPEGVNPWIVETQDGVEHHRLDVNLLAHDAEAERKVAAEKIRTQRDMELEASDKIVFALKRRLRVSIRADGDTAALESQLAAWDTYRELLCALPETAGFPHEVQWPERPE